MTEAVRRFYERFPFPGDREFDADGLVLLRALRRQRPRIASVLDAGCGTGHTASSVARSLPDASVVGIDVCARSLSLARRAAAEAGVPNLRFVQGDLMELPVGSRRFDAVLCLGVLHHTADMPGVLRRLVTTLARDGVLYLWLYGRHGRYLHELNVRLLHVLLSSDDSQGERLALARELVRGARDGAVLRELVDSGPAPSNLERTTANDAWIADQFLHVHERSVDMPEVLALLDSAGLRLTEWFGVDDRAAAALGSERLRERFAMLDERSRLAALDLLLRPPRYFVTAERTDRGS